MAQTTLPAPRPQVAPRRRAFFGLFDADGWGWASAKAIFWFVTIIMLLGYLPDRAYYFTVQRTVDLGLLLWSPINFCPPSNVNLPCPAPVGATLPWQPSPPEIQLPAGRSDGVAGVMGQVYIYAGGTDGTAPVADVHVARAVGDGNLDGWKDAPPLPEARASAAGAVIGNTIFVIGGYGPDGQPTDTDVQPHGRQRRLARRVGDGRRREAPRAHGRRGGRRGLGRDRAGGREDRRRPDHQRLEDPADEHGAADAAGVGRPEPAGRAERRRRGLPRRRLHLPRRRHATRAAPSPRSRSARWAARGPYRPTRTR